MTAETFWDAVWITVFAAILVALSVTLLPTVPSIQMVVVPMWFGYWMLTRRPQLSAWIAFFGGMLLESAWGVPPGGCILFFFTIWQLIRLFRKELPKEIQPLHGLLAGVVFAPFFRLWIWAYSIFWLGLDAADAIRPGLTGIFVMPAVGALGGGAVFALAKAWSFDALEPKQEETLSNEGQD